MKQLSRTQIKNILWYMRISKLITYKCADLKVRCCGAVRRMIRDVGNMGHLDEVQKTDKLHQILKQHSVKFDLGPMGYLKSKSFLPRTCRLKGAANGYGLVDYKNFQGYAQLYSLVNPKGELMLFFQSTDWEQKWDDIFNFELVSANLLYNEVGIPGRVHQGFVQAFMYADCDNGPNARDHIRDLVRRYLKGSNKKVILAGHSLGGQLALMAAVMIKLEFELPIECVSYGSCKVGNCEFAEAVESMLGDEFMYHRLVNPGDLVPELPPGDYKHIGEAIVLGEGNGYSTLELLFASLGNDFKCHHLQDYYLELKKWMKNRT